jgi:intracellular septation protein
MLVVTFVIVTAFGGMTIYLQDPIFVYIKPTIINLLFCVTILGCFAFGFNVWKALFGSIFEMPERAWYMLGIRWALFFALMALLNEVLWRHITGTVVTADMRWFEGLSWSESFWVNFRFFGTYPLFFLFVLANVPLTLKYAREAGAADKADSAQGET